MLLTAACWKLFIFPESVKSIASKMANTSLRCLRMYKLSAKYTKRERKAEFIFYLDWNLLLYVLFK